MNKHIPYHIAIIPDGNRRWAKENGLSSMIGHRRGFERTIDIINHAQEMGVKVITFYAFSTENWRRAKTEVNYLMKLFVMAFDRYVKEFHKMGIKIRHLGNFENLTTSSIKKIEKSKKLTEKNDKMVLQIALNYGGRDEIKRAIQKIVEKNPKPEDITEKLINENLDTGDLHEPDLIIRTSGEQRLSNFLPWQGAYSELYFTKTYWPDFSIEELEKAIAEYSFRQRRFGS